MNTMTRQALLPNRPTPLWAMDEPSLIAAAQDGDRRALDRLLRLYQPQVQALCRRITGNETDAHDAAQDALIALVRGLPRFDGRSRFSTWLYRVVTNACLDELRRRRRRPVVGLPELDGATVEPVDVRQESVADQVVGRSFIDEVLGELPDAYRAALVLRELGQFEYAEIAEILGVPTGTVRSRIARGRAHLAGRRVGGCATGEQASGRQLALVG
jgi:RNA polymerase sigma-70 factor (ECF subfamily)